MVRMILIRCALLLAAICLTDAGGAIPLELRHAAIVHDAAGSGNTTQLAAEMLADDLTALGASRPNVTTNMRACRDTCILIGRYDAPLVARLAHAGGIDLSALHGAWER